MQELLAALSEGLDRAPTVALLASAAWGVTSMLVSPCHLAGIPLIVGFIHGGSPASGRRAAWLATLFAVGMLVTIALIGLVTASLGRIAGDLGAWSYYLVAGVFFLAGLHLLDVLPSPWSSPDVGSARSRGPLGALLLGLVFGIALGPCTFAFMAPVLGVAFGTASDSPLLSGGLLLAYGVGHCSIIVIAGSATGLVRRYLAWSGRSNGVARFRQASAILVLAAGFYLLWIAP
jgi:cytochrome c-type biogenesis protein